MVYSVPLLAAWVVCWFQTFLDNLYTLTDVPVYRRWLVKLSDERRVSVVQDMQALPKVKLVLSSQFIWNTQGKPTGLGRSPTTSSLLSTELIFTSPARRL